MTTPDSGSGPDSEAAAPGFRELIESVQGAITIPQARLLRRLARRVTTGAIIEVGSFRGRSTVALATGSAEGSQAPVYAIEPHETFDGPFGGKFGPTDRREFFRNMLRTEAWKHVRLVNVSSEVVAPGWTQPVAMLWIDGDHQYEAVKRDWECWRPHLVDDAFVVFDDTNRGGPKQLVDELVDQGWRVTHHVGKVRALASPH